MNLRNLFQVSNETECTVYCDPACPYYDCYKDPYTSPPPPPPTTTASQSHPLSPYIVVISTSFASFILLVFSYFMIKRCCSRRQGSEENQRAGHEEDHFLDENRGPAIDHHIWYINTEGLQPSIINSISVFRYRKGGNLIEGSECSVCLSEFQEDETLRLLPKCSHAFHTHCIDTWLRSHTNCPLCRARIMSNSNVAQNSVDRNNQEQEQEDSADLGQEEGSTQMENSGENGENRGGGVETEGGRDEFDDGVRDWSFMRRSVSMDFGHSYVPKSLAENTHIESEEGASSRNQGSFAVCMKRSLSATCSHSGRVILPRCNRNLNSVLPL